MTSPDRENHNNPEQGGARKDTYVVFHSRLHSPFNLQSIGSSIESFREVLERSLGRSIIYFEDARQSHEQAAINKEFISKQGFTTFIYASILLTKGVFPSPENVEQLHKEISRHNLQSSIDMGQLPIEMAHMFALSLYLDELRTKYPFDVEFESHDNERVTEISDIVRQSSDINQESVEYWNRGQFTQALERHKRQIHIAHRATSLREPDVIQDLEEKTRELVQEKKQGGLFVFFGAAHAPVVDSLRERMGDANVGYEIKKTGLEEQSHEFVSYDSLRKGKPVSDEMYARHLLESLMTTGTEQLCIENGRIANYMLNYETLARTISGVAASFSLQQIEEIARSRRGVLDVLRRHPMNAPLLPYISRLLI